LWIVFFWGNKVKPAKKMTRVVRGAQQWHRHVKVMLVQQGESKERRTKQSGVQSNMTSVEEAAPAAALPGSSMAAMSEALTSASVAGAGLGAEFLFGARKSGRLRAVSAAVRTGGLVAPSMVWGKASQNSKEWLGMERRASRVLGQTVKRKEGKAGDKGRAFGGVSGGDHQGDGLAWVIAETQSNRIFDMENWAADGAANALSFEGGIAGTAMASKSSKQLGWQSCRGRNEGLADQPESQSSWLWGRQQHGQEGQEVPTAQLGWRSDGAQAWQKQKWMMQAGGANVVAQVEDAEGWACLIRAMWQWCWHAKAMLVWQSAFATSDVIDDEWLAMWWMSMWSAVICRSFNGSQWSTWMSWPSTSGHSTEASDPHGWAGDQHWIIQWKLAINTNALAIHMNERWRSNNEQWCMSVTDRVDSRMDRVELDGSSRVGWMDRVQSSRMDRVQSSRMDQVKLDGSSQVTHCMHALAQLDRKLEARAITAAVMTPPTLVQGVIGLDCQQGGESARVMHGCIVVAVAVAVAVACFPKWRVFPNSNPLWDRSQRVGSWLWVVFDVCVPRQKTFQVWSASVGDKTSWFDGGKLAGQRWTESQKHMWMAAAVMTPPTLARLVRLDCQQGGERTRAGCSCICRCVVVAVACFPKQREFPSSSNPCETDLKGLGFGLCLPCACHDKRRSKSVLLPLVLKPPDLMVES
jgi:hypothetical protein